MQVTSTISKAAVDALSAAIWTGPVVVEPFVGVGAPAWRVLERWSKDLDEEHVRFIAWRDRCSEGRRIVLGAMKDSAIEAHHQALLENVIEVIEEKSEALAVNLSRAKKRFQKAAKEYRQDSPTVSAEFLALSARSTDLGKRLIDEMLEFALFLHSVAAEAPTDDNKVVTIGDDGLRGHLNKLLAQ